MSASQAHTDKILGVSCRTYITVDPDEIYGLAIYLGSDTFAKVGHVDGERFRISLVFLPGVMTSSIDYYHAFFNLDAVHVPTSIIETAVIPAELNFTDTGGGSLDCHVAYNDLCSSIDIYQDVPALVWNP